MSRFVKYLFNDMTKGSRNKRELSVVKKFGCEIIVCTVGQENCVKEVDGYTVFQRKISLSKNSIIRKTQILINWVIKEPLYLRKLKADYISCQDLLALFIGWISTLFIPKKRKPLLIYDSHEFELGRNTNGKRSKIAYWIVFILEKFLIKRAKLSLFACESAAEEVKRLYKLKEKPVVVRNIPNYWHINKDEIRLKRIEICKGLGISENTFLAIYHGLIGYGRGLENFIKSIRKAENTAAVILGFGDVKYIQELKKLCKEQNVFDKVLFLPAVPLNELYRYLGAADVGMVTVQAVSQSYYFMLPNKFFENIQSLTPIICSNFPEVSTIIRKYDIGLTVDPDNIDEIAGAIMKMQYDSALYNRFKKNLERAKEDLCWENESKILEDAYEKILKN